jgi:hypothetical protein
MDIAATHHWFGLVTPPTRMIQSTGNSLLAVTPDFGEVLFTRNAFFLGWVRLATSQRTKYLKSISSFLFPSRI